MQYRRFHDPNLCPKLIRRKLGESLLDMLHVYLAAGTPRGRARLWWGSTYPNREVYNAALYRLRKAGLVVYDRSAEGQVRMALTDEGRERLPAVCRPEPFWNRKWTGLWYMLVYDVPESDRRYRDVLRGFLGRMRMGCLQKSVYISPSDIRSEYEDLDEAAEVRRYSFLFEAETVLNHGPQSVVCSAWNFDRLWEEHGFYLDVCRSNLRLLHEGQLNHAAIEALAQEELDAYLTVMDRDPLLPKELLPVGYRGHEVYDMHRQFAKAIAKRLRWGFLHGPRASGST